jgi:hypothetical protein
MPIVVCCDQSLLHQRDDQRFGQVIKESSGLTTRLRILKQCQRYTQGLRATHLIHIGRQRYYARMARERTRFDPFVGRESVQNGHLQIH